MPNLLSENVFKIKNETCLAIERENVAGADITSSHKNVEDGVNLAEEDCKNNILEKNYQLGDSDIFICKEDQLNFQKNSLSKQLLISHEIEKGLVVDKLIFDKQQFDPFMLPENVQIYKDVTIKVDNDEKDEMEVFNTNDHRKSEVKDSEFVPQEILGEYKYEENVIVTRENIAEEAYVESEKHKNNRKVIEKPEEESLQLNLEKVPHDKVYEYSKNTTILEQLDDGHRDGEDAAMTERYKNHLLDSKNDLFGATEQDLSIARSVEYESSLSIKKDTGNYQELVQENDSDWKQSTRYSTIGSDDAGLGFGFGDTTKLKHQPLEEPNNVKQEPWILTSMQCTPLQYEEQSIIGSTNGKKKCNEDDNETEIEESKTRLISNEETDIINEMAYEQQENKVAFKKCDRTSEQVLNMGEIKQINEVEKDNVANVEALHSTSDDTDMKDCGNITESHNTLINKDAKEIVQIAIEKALVHTNKHCDSHISTGLTGTENGDKVILEKDEPDCLEEKYELMEFELFEQYMKEKGAQSPFQLQFPENVGEVFSSSETKELSVVADEYQSKHEKTQDEESYKPERPHLTSHLSIILEEPPLKNKFVADLCLPDQKITPNPVHDQRDDENFKKDKPTIIDDKNSSQNLTEVLSEDESMSICSSQQNYPGVEEDSVMIDTEYNTKMVYTTAELSYENEREHNKTVQDKKEYMRFELNESNIKEEIGEISITKNKTEEINESLLFKDVQNCTKIDSIDSEDLQVLLDTPFEEDVKKQTSPRTTSKINEIQHTIVLSTVTCYDAEPHCNNEGMMFENFFNENREDHAILMQNLDEEFKTDMKHDSHDVMKTTKGTSHAIGEIEECIKKDNNIPSFIKAQEQKSTLSNEEYKESCVHNNAAQLVFNILENVTRKEKENLKRSENNKDYIENHDDQIFVSFKKQARQEEFPQVNNNETSQEEMFVEDVSDVLNLTNIELPAEEFSEKISQSSEESLKIEGNTFLNIDENSAQTESTEYRETMNFSMQDEMGEQTPTVEKTNKNSDEKYIKVQSVEEKSDSKKITTTNITGNGVREAVLRKKIYTTDLNSNVCFHPKDIEAENDKYVKEDFDSRKKSIVEEQAYALASEQTQDTILYAQAAELVNFVLEEVILDAERSSHAKDDHKEHADFDDKIFTSGTRHEDSIQVLTMTKEFQTNVMMEHNKCRYIHYSEALIWSDKLAEDAKVWALHLANKGCLKHSTSINHGENLAYSSGLLSGYDLSHLWYDEIKHYSYIKPGYTTSTENFTQMVWAETRKMGVGAAVSKDGTTYYVARYQPPGNKLGCFDINVSSPRKNMLDGRHRKKKSISSPEIPQSKNDNIKHECLVTHNFLRYQHGAAELKWSSTLSADALQYAERLASSSSINKSDFTNKGDNIAILSKDEFSVSKAMELWYGEIDDFDFASPAFSSCTRNFSQMIWKECKEVGMAISMSEDGESVVVVARYFPAGNVVGGFQKNVQPRSSERNYCF